MILFKEQIDVLSLKGFLDFLINRNLCVLFPVDRVLKWEEYNA